jgi:hypothetical protein
LKDARARVSFYFAKKAAYFLKGVSDLKKESSIACFLYQKKLISDSRKINHRMFRKKNLKYLLARMVRDSKIESFIACFKRN